MLLLCELEFHSISKGGTDARRRPGQRRGQRGRRPHPKRLRIAYDLLFRPPRPPRFFGTFAPALRASDRPIAIACLRLVTFLPERPLFSVPSLRSCIARFTLLCAFLPYRATVASFPRSGRGPVTPGWLPGTALRIPQ